ncbi:MAG: PIN domain-containing protein [Anaerolineales bacterium]|nr:PIN domain-containing protein [Anaerolineales bacterium]
MTHQLYRAVLDTNVIFEGLTKKGGACGLIVDAWFADLFQAYVSSALAYEYTDVLARKFSSSKWSNVQPILKTVLRKANYTSIYYSWRPASPDPGDDLVIDCAMNANAFVITANIKDFRKAQAELGLTVMTPVQFVMLLAE